MLLGRLVTSLTAVVFVISSWACSSTARLPQTPEAALSRYAGALRARDWDTAYSLLSHEARLRVSKAAFVQMVNENPEAVRRLVSQLNEGEVVTTATVTSPTGQAWSLVHEGGRWRASLASIDIYGQGTPEQTLASFVRAFQAKRYDILLRFVPAEKTDGLDAKRLQASFEGEMQREVTSLVRALDASIGKIDVERHGRLATAVYGAGGTVELVEEGGNWKIVDF